MNSNRGIPSKIGSRIPQKSISPYAQQQKGTKVVRPQKFRRQSTVANTNKDSYAKPAIPAAKSQSIIIAKTQAKPRLNNLRTRLQTKLKGPKFDGSNAKAIPGPKIQDELVLNSFKNRTYTNRLLQVDTTFYKYHGVNNRTGKKFSWVTNRKYGSEDELRRDLAIRKDWGRITKLTEFRAEKGTWVSEGVAGSQGQGYPGNGYQAVIQNVPRNWIVRTSDAFK